MRVRDLGIVLSPVHLVNSCRVSLHQLNIGGAVGSCGVAMDKIIKKVVLTPDIYANRPRCVGPLDARLAGEKVSLK